MVIRKVFAIGRRKISTGGHDAESLVRGYSLFDENDYLQANPDVKAAITGGAFSTPFQHFQLHGNAERRFPGYAGFNWDEYIRANPDLASFRNNHDPEARAKQHFREAGYAEGRKIKA